MIRDFLKEKITYKLCADWNLKQHCNCVSYETLEVDSSGNIYEREEPSSNSWHTGTHVLMHTFGVPCNCDWCAEWDENVNEVQSDFDCKSDFIKACIDNNDVVSATQDNIFSRIDEIPTGFFDDEKEVPMKKFIICYYGTSGDGYVGYDNRPCSSYEMAMKFDTEEAAESARVKLQEEWESELSVSEVDDE